MSKIPLRFQRSFSLKKLWPTIKNILIFVIITYVIIFIASLPSATTIDFAIVRNSFNNYGNRASISNETSKKLIQHKTASEAMALALKQQAEREKYVNESRARTIVESATNDYYRGSYEDALRRLERARIYDPSNFSAFKLTGQIFFEHNQYRKAFNNWERASELPNDDKTIARDLDVLRKLLRHSRNEIDKLRHTVNTKPDDKVAKARLKELEERVEE